MAAVTQNRRRTPRRRRKGGPLTRQAAIDLARAAVEGLEEGDVGEHVGVTLAGRGAATHRFASDLPGYRGWEWHVVLASAPGSDYVTVSEVALVPGDQALQAPDWVPYEDRVRPGDLGPRDLMPPADDDERLTRGDPGHRRLSDAGIRDAARRWRDGNGPGGEYARQALRHCGSCAFLVPLTGRLGDDFGVCTNEWTFDAEVVHLEHGCGAHSATPAQGGEGLPAGEAWDDERR